MFPMLALSCRVWTMTSWPPVGADGSIFSVAVAVIGEVTVTAVTVMPVPKSAVVTPCWKCKPAPLSSTLTPCSPCSTLAGFAVRSNVTECSGAFTSNPLARVTTSEPVVMVTARAPLLDPSTCT